MTEPMDPGAAARALAHDVGKYLARAARNLPPEGAIPKVLIDMLARDLYAPLPSGEVPRDRFEALAARLTALGVTDARLSETSARFDALAVLRAGIDRRDPEAIRGAAALALEIERALSSLAKALASPGGRLT